MLRGDAHFVDSWFPLMQDQRQPQPGRGRGGSDRRSGCGGSRRSRGRCRRGGGRRGRCRRGGVPRRGSDRCGALDAVAVGVVQERRQRRRSLLHLGQAVFVVEDEGVGRSSDGSGRLVSVAVVAVRVAIGARHGVFVAAVAVGIRIAGVAGQVADRIVDVGVVQAEGAAVVSDHLSCGTPQTCTVPSASPHANKLPSGLQATAVTG